MKPVGDSHFSQNTINGAMCDFYANGDIVVYNPVEEYWELASNSTEQLGGGELAMLLDNNTGLLLTNGWDATYYAGDSPGKYYLGGTGNLINALPTTPGIIGRYLVS